MSRVLRGRETVTRALDLGPNAAELLDVHTISGPR
jgi:hypothetical protein